MSSKDCHVADLLALCTSHLDKQDEVHKEIDSLRENDYPLDVGRVVKIVSTVRQSAGDHSRLQDVYTQLVNVVGIPSLVRCLLSRLKELNLAGTVKGPDDDGLVLPLVCLYSDVLCALVSKSGWEEDDDENVVDVVLELVMAVLERCLPAVSDNDVDVERSGTMCKNETKSLLDLAFHALTFTSKLNSHCCCEHSKQRLQQMTPILLLVCGMHWKHHNWTNASIVKTTHKLADIFINICKQKSINELLSGQPGSHKGHLGDILKLLRPHLKKNLIAHAHMAMTSFHWCLQRVRHPTIGPHLPSLTPSLLLSVDAYESHIKILGLKCMNRVINEVDPSELRLYDRAEVIYAALKPHVYTNDPTVLRQLYPPLLGIIQVLEPIAQRMRHVGRRGKLDEVFSTILSSALCEGKIAVRRAHASHLHRFVAAMGIGGCKHLRRLLDLIFCYLEFPDVDMEETRLSAMRTLEVVIQQMWPRMPVHGTDVAKRIIRLIVECSKGERSDDQLRERDDCELTIRDVTIDYFRDFAESDARCGILLASFKCLVLLLRCCGERVRGEVESVRNTKDHATVGHVVDMAFRLM